MRVSFLFASLLAGALVALSSGVARAQVTINIGRPAPPPPVVVVHEHHHPKKWKAPKRHYYRPQPVLLVPARPGYYAPPGPYYGPGRGHGHGHGRGHGRH